MCDVRSGIRTAAALAAGLLVLAGCGSPEQGAGTPVAGVTMHDDDGMHGIVLPDPYEAADLALTATDGSPYRLATDTEKPLTLVFFGYTCLLYTSDAADEL